MNAKNYLRTLWNTPFIAQRADPYVLRHGDRWYFTGSVPEYDRIALRTADSLEGLRAAEETVVWRAHENGDMSQHVWAPELRFLDGAWYIYFAASRRDDIWALRPWVLRCESDDPMAGPWTECGMVKRVEGDEFSFTDFSLDMTVFEAAGRRYAVWAEKVSVGRKISNLYIAELADPLTLKTPQMLLSSPSYDWERHGFWVNEGPTAILHDGRVFVTYSASDTGPAYCLGLLWADVDADLMDIAAWHKLDRPVFSTHEERGLFGPGHNTFFTDETGEVCTAYHARQYDEIVGDPLYDPNRHCYIMKVRFENGLPVFGADQQMFQ